MMRTLVLLILVAGKVVVKTLLSLVMTTTNVQMTPAITLTDAVTIVSFVTIMICVLKIVVAHKLDVTLTK
jgi:hypothetical protein